MATTLRDIATELNISPTLVSRVLNEKPGIWASEATRVRILETAERLNYRPSASARALVTGKSMLIAVPAADAKWYDARLGREAEMRGLIEAAATHKYRVLVLPSRDSRASVSEFEALVRSNDCDGFCLYAEQAGTELYHLLSENRTPFVVIGHPHVTDVPRVDYDHRAMIRDSVEWLVEQSRRHIVLIDPPSSVGEAPVPPCLQIIKATFEESIARTVGNFAPDIIQSRVWSADDMVAWLRERRPDALILRGLASTLQWKFALTRAGIASPDEVLIMAHLDLAELAYLEQGDLQHGLACHVHDPQAVGQKAGDVLIRWINGHPPQTAPIFVPSAAPRWC